MMIHSSAFAGLFGDHLTDSEKAAKAAWQATLDRDQEAVIEADKKLKQYDYLDYELQKNAADIADAERQIDSANKGLAALAAQNITDKNNPAVANLTAVLAAQTERLNGDAGTVVGLKDARNDLLDKQKAIGIPDQHAVEKIFKNAKTVERNNMEQGLKALGDTGLGKNDDKLANKLSNINYNSIEKKGDKAAQDFMKSTYTSDELKDYKNWRKDHPSTPIEDPKPVAVVPAAPALVPVAVPVTPPAPVAMVPAAVVAPVAVTPPAPPPTPKAPDISCDQVYVELAQLIMANPKNGQILSNMIKSAAIKMAVFAAGTSSNQSLQTMEAYAHQKDVSFTDQNASDFRIKLEKMYKTSTQEAATINAAAQAATPGSSYFNKKVRLTNEDSSAFILYLSQHPELKTGFTTSDAAAVWAQGQIFQNKHLKLGDLAGNSMNFSSQVYYLTNNIHVWKAKDIAGGSKTFDDDTETKVQAEVDAVFKDTKQKDLVAAIQAKGCLKQDDNKTVCDPNTTKIGSDSLESIKQKIADLANKKEMDGLSKYTLTEPPNFDENGNFTVKFSASPLSTAEAPPASTTNVSAPAVTNTNRTPAAAANGASSPVTSVPVNPNAATTPQVTGSANPNSGQHIHGQGGPGGSHGNWHHNPAGTGSADPATPANQNITPPVQ